MSKKFQIVFSNEEYEFLLKSADEKGISVSQFIRDRLFTQQESFETKWGILLNRIEELPPNIEVNIATICGSELWQSLDKSTKLSLARSLNKQVKQGKIKGLKIIGKSTANVTLFIKD